MYPRLLIVGLILAGALHAASLRVTGIRCESEQNPLAVEAVRPRLSWLVESVDPARRALRQWAYRILVASSEKLLAQDRGDLWDSGKVESNATIQIRYEGRPLAPQSRAYWKVAVWDQDGSRSDWSLPGEWRMGLRPEDWKAKWIAAPVALGSAAQMPIFRRSFRLPQRSDRAIISISGLGQYELTLNGREVSEDLFTPGWTDYRKTVFYNTYDVTSQLDAGENVLAVMLGNGMYNVVRTPDRYTKFAGTFGEPRLIAQLHVTFADGTSTEVITDASWKCRAGPIVFSSIYGGEDYDAGLDPEGWRSAGFSDGWWAAARETYGPGGALLAQSNEPVRALETFQPVRIAEPKPGIRVYDLGRNFSGWPQIRIKGPAARTVRLICGELLDDAGLVTQRSSGGPQWFTYALRGNGEESWHPRFSYYGFRYVQVEIPSGVEVLELDGQFIHSSAARAGEFSCSKDLFNRIHRLIDAAIDSNFQSVLTDCPHREKLGWLEESHLLGAAVMYNYDSERQYRKIAGDIAASQTADGLVPDIAPEYTVFEAGFRDSPEWGSAAIIDPWLAYRHYGNRETLETHYGEMKHYVEYLSGKAAGGIISYGLGDWYDIGPKPPGVAQLTSLGVTATAIYYQDLVTLGKIASVLGKPEDARRLGADAEEIRAKFNSQLFDAQGGFYDRGSQTANAMPLALDMVPDQARRQVLDRLVADIRQHGNHTTAGDIGFHYVLQALSEGDRSDVIYDLLVNPESPSYAAQLLRGATSLTEAWDGNPHSSQNHFMLGHAEEWFYSSLAGIDFDLSRPPWQQIILRPQVVGDIASARATYRSVLGTIVSSWKIERGRLVYDIEIPANASAVVYVPSGGAPAARRVESGRYHFEAER